MSVSSGRSPGNHVPSGEARKVIASKYTWKEITAQTDELYKKLLNG